MDPQGSKNFRVRNFTEKKLQQKCQTDSFKIDFMISHKYCLTWTIYKKVW
jgi:hypothetical protein